MCNVFSKFDRYEIRIQPIQIRAKREVSRFNKYIWGLFRKHQLHSHESFTSQQMQLERSTFIVRKSALEKTQLSDVLITDNLF